MDRDGRTRPQPGLAFILSLITMLTKEPETLQPGAFYEHNAAKRRLRPELRPGPHWGTFSSTPDPLAGFEGAASGQGGGRQKKEGMEVRGEWGEEQGERRSGWQRSWNQVFFADWQLHIQTTHSLQLDLLNNWSFRIPMD